MSLSAYALPFGLRQVRLTPYDAAGDPVPADAVFLPASRTFSFVEAESFEELEGDDQTIASHGAGPVVNWDLEGGGISLEAYAILAGGTVTSTGITPNIVKTYSKLTTNARPYFQVDGRAISDSGGDFKTAVYRCKADGDIGGELKNGSFYLTKAKGMGYGRLDTFKLYDFIHSETATALVIP